MLETVTISLDHYLELVRLQIKYEETQRRLDTEYVTTEEILNALELVPRFNNEFYAKYLEEKEGAADELQKVKG